MRIFKDVYLKTVGPHTRLASSMRYRIIDNDAVIAYIELMHIDEITYKMYGNIIIRVNHIIFLDALYAILDTPSIDDRLSRIMRFKKELINVI